MRYDDELDQMRAGKSRRKSKAPKSRRKSSGGPRSTREGGGKRRDPAKRRRVKIIIAEVVVLIVLLVFAAYTYVSRMFSKMNQENFDEEQVINSEITEEQKEQMKGYWTVACFGLDPRSGNLSDVNMICNINRETGEIRLVSIFRDTYLNISEKNSYNKINAAYGQGGPTQAVAALNKNLGLNITEYASFSWEAVAQAINLLGGVDIEISDAEFYYMNAFITETVQVTGIYSTQLKKSGLNHLDGVQAVAYGRLRLMDNDYARTERQRIVLNKAFEKAKQADWAVLNNIIQTVIIPNVSTNIDINDIIPMAWDIKKYHMGETAGFPFARGEVRKAGKITDIVVPQTLETNVVQLQKFLFDVDDYQVPSNVKQISNHIAEATGLSTPAKPVTGHVRTDQGFVPKKKSSSTTNTSSKTEETTKAEETTENETTTAYETDEYGNLIDPPEDLLPSESTSEGESQAYESGPGYPTEEYGPGSSAANPGNISGTQGTTAAYNGTQSNKPQESKTQESKPQESKTPVSSPQGETTAAVRPGGEISSSAPETTNVSPGNDSTTAAPATGQIVLPPGQETGPGYQPGPGGGN